MENYVTKLCNDISSELPEECQVKESADSVRLETELQTGVKGIHVSVECNERNVKVKGHREYEYPISEIDIERFQEQAQNDFPGHNVFISGQTLSYSKFFSYESADMAKEETLNSINAIRNIVSVFEKECVNFLEKQVETETAEYDPEKAVEIFEVDNRSKGLPTAQVDNKEFEENALAYTREVFRKQAEKYNADPEDTIIQVKEEGKIFRITRYPAEPDLLITVSIPVEQDIASLYISHVNANYPELRAVYGKKNRLFIVKSYVTPSMYTPEIVDETLHKCMNAVDSCIVEFSDNLKKKDSADFASDLQKVLQEQVKIVDEREKQVTEREKEVEVLVEKLNEQREAYEIKLRELQDEKESLMQMVEEQNQELQMKKEAMEAEIQKYKESKTKDLVNIKQLAAQVSSLQNRLSNAGGDADSDENIYRLETKVRQITSQRIAMEKALTEKLTQKDAKVTKMADVIAEKDRELSQLKDVMDDVIAAKISEETEKTQNYISSLEEKIQQQGHVLTADELIQYYKKVNSEDMDIKKRHAQTATVVTFEEGSINIRIIFSTVNFVELSKVATLNPKKLKRFNDTFSDVKFFCRENTVVARMYFSNTATAEKVDEVVEDLSGYFKE